jgi:type IV secretory pathway component VirB8
MKALLKVQIEDLRKNSISTTYGYLQRHKDTITRVDTPSNNFGSIRWAYRFNSKQEAEKHLLKHYINEIYFGYRRGTKTKIFKYTYSITKI